MASQYKSTSYDFKGLGFSKIGHFKQVRAKIKELEDLSRELTLRHNELGAIIDNMTDGLTILDKDLNVVFVNRVQQVLFPGAQPVGRKCFEAFYNKTHFCRECPALKTIETNKTLRGEMVARKGDLAGRCFEWTTSPITCPSGHTQRVILLMRDITERKEYEFNLLRADRMAAIGLLAAGLAHEINNPLTSIAGFSEGLLKRLKSAPDLSEEKMAAYFRDYLEIINNEAYRCKDIIQNLIRFSRSPTDDYETLDIDQIINDTASLIRQHAKDNSIKIVVKNCSETESSRIVGNEAELKHLFLNLFNNALDSTRDGGRLTVLSRNKGNSVEIAISTINGYFPADSHEGALHPAHTANPGAGGTPLSLSICYNIMQHHKGDIQVNTIRGKGAAFILRFPCAATAENPVSGHFE